MQASIFHNLYLEWLKISSLLGPTGGIFQKSGTSEFSYIPKHSQLDRHRSSLLCHLTRLSLSYEVWGSRKYVASLKTYIFWFLPVFEKITQLNSQITQFFFSEVLKARGFVLPNPTPLFIVIKKAALEWGITPHTTFCQMSQSAQMKVCQIMMKNKAKCSLHAASESHPNLLYTPFLCNWLAGFQCKLEWPVFSSFTTISLLLFVWPLLVLHNSLKVDRWIIIVSLDITPVHSLHAWPTGLLTEFKGIFQHNFYFSFGDQFNF